MPEVAGHLVVTSALLLPYPTVDCLRAYHLFYRILTDNALISGGLRWNYVAFSRIFIKIAFLFGKSDSTIMKHLVKAQYEAPTTEVWVISMENNLLQASETIQATRDGYGAATNYDWE